METDTDRQVLTLRLGQAVFGIDVARVREVLDHKPVSPLANAPATLLGLIDVRGVAVPVVDLKRKLAISGESTIDQETRIVVLEVRVGGVERTLAVLADAVFEVMEVEQEAVERPPEVGEIWDSRFMRGLGRRDGAFLTLLEIDALFDRQEVAAAPAPAEMAA